MIGNVQVFVKYWAKQELLDRPSETVSEVVRLPSDGKEYLAIDARWFAKYEIRALIEVHSY